MGPEIADLLREHLENAAQKSPPESARPLTLEECAKPAEKVLEKT